MVDFEAPRRAPEDLDDVEPARYVVEAPLHEEELSDPRHAASFHPADRLGRSAESRASSRFDLDEDQDVAVPGDQVDLPEAAAKPALHHLQPGLLEKPRGGILAVEPQPLARVAGTVGPGQRSTGSEASICAIRASIIGGGTRKV